MFGGPICGIETRRTTGHRADGEYGIWGQTRCLGIRQSGSKLPHSKRFAPTNAHCIHGSALETIGISALFLATESQGIFPIPT